MSAPPVLRDARRGADLDMIELIDEQGRVLLLHAYGLTEDEKRRTRERALALLRQLVEIGGTA